MTRYSLLEYTRVGDGIMAIAGTVKVFEVIVTKDGGHTWGRYVHAYDAEQGRTLVAALNAQVEAAAVAELHSDLNSGDKP